MDSQLLKQFVHLAEQLHFGQASELCLVSPSSLSRRIRKLENELGVSLFERNNRSVSLTHAGALFLDYSRNALAEWETIRNTLMLQSGELHGEIRMYCSVTASYSFLFDILESFRQKHPHIEIKLHTGDPEDAVERVVSGHEDISIGAKPDRLPAGLTFKPIAISPLVFIAAKSLTETRLSESGPFNPASFAARPMILPERGLARQRVDDWFRLKEITPRIYSQVAGNEAIVSMVSLGFGIGVVPRIVLDNSPLAGSVKVLETEPELNPYEVGLFTQEKRLSSPLIRTFWSQLK